MVPKHILLCVTLLIFFGIVQGQSMAVDMDTASGIQEALTVHDTAQTVIVTLQATSVTELFSYQCKVNFDTSQFSFIAAEQDFGALGEKNILAKDGGAVIGICQLQANPPASDTVEFSGTITGTDASKSVSGDGIIGVLYLKSKAGFNDSTTISITQGFLAEFEESMVEVTNYSEGTFKIEEEVHISPWNKKQKYGETQNSHVINVMYQFAVAQFTFPYNTFSVGSTIHCRLFSLDGKQIVHHSFTITNDQIFDVVLPSSVTTQMSNVVPCVCSINIGTKRLTQSMIRN